MNTKFACGVDVTFNNNGAYVCDYMGLFSTVAEAVVCNSELHSSFGYTIYEVETKETGGLRRVTGLRSGSTCTGLKIIRKVCAAFDHPAWPKSSN